MSNDTYSVLIADGIRTDRLSLKRAIESHAPKLRVVGEVEHADQLTDYLFGRNLYADRADHPFPDLLVIDLLIPPQGALQFLFWLRTQEYADRLKVAVLSDVNLSISPRTAGTLGAMGFYTKSPLYEVLQGVAQSLQADLLNPSDPAPPAGP